MTNAECRMDVNFQVVANHRIASFGIEFVLGGNGISASELVDFHEVESTSELFLNGSDLTFLHSDVTNENEQRNRLASS
jgi:hypothetical protein